MNNKNTNSYVDMWRWDKNRYIIETNDSKVSEKISKWTFVSNGPAYGVNHYRRQFLIPANKAMLAHKLLDIKHVKNENRVKAGQQASKNHPIRRG